MSVFFRISMIFLVFNACSARSFCFASVSSQSEKATMPELDLKLVSLIRLTGGMMIFKKALIPLYCREKILKNDSKKHSGLNRRWEIMVIAGYVSSYSE